MVKKLVRILVIFVFSLFLLFKLMEWWIEIRFEAKINAKPDRAYDLTYEDLDLHNFFRGVTLTELKIVPLKADSGTVVRGAVEYANLEGMVWRDLFFSKRLNIAEIVFEKPVFSIALSNDTLKKSGGGKGLQELFGDVLSRGQLKKFEIVGGSVLITEPVDGQEGNGAGIDQEKLLKGQVSNLNLVAAELKTDSVQWTHLIPFELGKLQVSVDSVSFDLDEYSAFRSGRMEYRMRDRSLILRDLDLYFKEDWISISKKIGVQKDLMEIKAGELRFEQLEASSSLYSDLDIVSDKIRIENLIFKDNRDKNMPRPSDKVKPMFKGMVDKIPFALKVDSIEIVNSEVWYSELPLDKKYPGTVKFQNINGMITKLTTFEELKKDYGYFEGRIKADLNGGADVDLHLTVPYATESFRAVVDVGPMDLAQLNATVQEMVGVKITSGDSQGIHLEMNATKSSAKNHMTFDYENLKINVLKEGENHDYHDRPFLSALANSAVRNHNSKEHGKYLVADYQTERNVHRGPFNFIFASVMDGMLHIVPGRTIQQLLGVDKKDKKKKKKKSEQ